MKDPRRLAAHDATRFEQRLLDAAANDRIPPEATLRMAEGLGLSTGAGVATGAGATALSAKTGVLLWVGIAAMAGVLGVIGRGLLLRHAPAAAATVALPPDDATVGSVATANAAAPSAPSTGQPAFGGPAGGPASRARAPVAPARPVDPSGARDLRAEIALLDSARDALAAEAPQRARAALDRYARRYPHGTFAPEAQALRIEALIADGNPDGARTRARRFLREHPDSPLAERVERLTAPRR